MTFRLITVLYLFALLAASLAVCGVWGAIVGLLIANNWRRVVAGQQSSGAIAEVVALLWLALLISVASDGVAQPQVGWSYTRVYGAALLIIVALLPSVPAARWKIWPPKFEQ